MRGSPEKIRLALEWNNDEFSSQATSLKYDFIEVNSAGGIRALRELEKASEYSSKMTRPSLSYFLTTQTKTLSRDQRVSLAEMIQRELYQGFQLQPEIEKVSYELLPPNTFGSLRLGSVFVKGPPKPTLPKKLKFAVVDPQAPIVLRIRQILESAGIQVQTLPLFEQYANADLALWAQGMNLDYPEIEFYLILASQWALISGTEQEIEWINQAGHEVDQVERKKLFEKIGTELLTDGRVIPLFIRSYVHLFRSKRLTIDQVTHYDGDIAFYKMQIQDP